MHKSVNFLNFKRKRLFFYSFAASMLVALSLVFITITSDFANANDSNENLSNFESSNSEVQLGPNGERAVVVSKFENEIHSKTFYYDTKDHSSEGDVYDWESIDWRGGSILGHYTLYHIDISFSSYRPINCSKCFYNSGEIKNILYFNTSNATNMSGMFSGCSNFTSIDVSSLDTTNVTDMSNMFENCKALKSIKWGNFNTSNCIDMYGMFSGCIGFESLNLNNFNTTNVKSMGGMFKGCSSLISLNISNFKTTNVVGMSNMFNGCSSLTSLELSNFDTSKAESMVGMFAGCSGLKKLDLANFNTSNVTSMGGTWNPPDHLGMFSGCSGLTSLNLSNFVTSKVTDMSSMFQGCSSLKELDISNFDTSKVTYMQSMFNGCISLVSLDLNNFDTTWVTTMRGMFSGCKGLTSLNINNFETSRVSDMALMFQGCNSLSSLNINSFNTSKVTWMDCMLEDCYGLVELDLSNIDISNVTSMNRIFYGCKKIKTLYVLENEDWTKKATGYFSDLFTGCTSLVGGNNTEYDPNNTDITYARVDGLNGKPGYFTAKLAPTPGDIEIPAGNYLVYNGQNQLGVNAGVGYSISGNIGKTSGFYVATVKLLDPKNTTWVDGTKTDKYISWSINKAVLVAKFEDEMVDVRHQPQLKINVNGFVNGESPETTSGYESPKIDVPSVLTPGVYTLTPEGGKADNYIFVNNPGTLIVVDSKVDINECQINPIDDSFYTGQEIQPHVALSFLAIKLPESEYKLSFLRNVNVGKATINIEGRDMFEGMRSVNFDIYKAKLEAKYSGETISSNETPKLELDVTGFVNGENKETADGYVAPKVNISESYLAGEYVVVPYGGEADNYEFSYTPGTLRVVSENSPSGNAPDVPQTGDETPLAIIVLIVLISTCSVLIFSLKRKENNIKL